MSWSQQRMKLQLISHKNMYLQYFTRYIYYNWKYVYIHAILTYFYRLTGEMCTITVSHVFVNCCIRFFFRLLLTLWKKKSNDNIELFTSFYLRIYFQKFSNLFSTFCPKKLHTRIFCLHIYRDGLWNAVTSRNHKTCSYLVFPGSHRHVYSPARRRYFNNKTHCMSE